MHGKPTKITTPALYVPDLQDPRTFPASALVAGKLDSDLSRVVRIPNAMLGGLGFVAGDQEFRIEDLFYASARMTIMYTVADGPDGGPCMLMAQTALPCPGVALRMNAVIDCRPGEERMPPITIEILKNLPAPEQQQQGGDGPQLALAGRFTCDCGDFVLFNQIRRVEAMVEEAGLPPECAPSLTCFFHQSASSGANSFYKAMAITVEAGDPRSIVVDEDEGEDEEVPPGADAGECAICYRAYLVGGGTSATLACGHAFHRRCLDRWTSVRRTCPYCRAPVPEELEYWDAGEDDREDAEEEYHAEYGDEEYEYRPGYYGDGEEERQYQVPGGETPSADAVWGSQPC